MFIDGCARYLCQRGTLMALKENEVTSDGCVKVFNVGKFVVIGNEFGKDA